MDAEQAILRVIHESAALNDRRHWSALARLYADDATLTRPNGDSVTGRVAIEQSYASGSPTRRTRHVCTNVLIDVDEPSGTANAETSVLLFTWEDVPGVPGLPDASGPAIGEFRDRLVLTADGWRIVARRASLSARASAP